MGSLMGPTYAGLISPSGLPTQPEEASGRSGGAVVSAQAACPEALSAEAEAEEE